jgi:hypothetical protein
MRLILAARAESQADAARLVFELANTLREHDVRAALIRADPTTMDVGTAIDVVLEANQIMALARILSAWLQRRPKAEISIQGEGDATIVADALTAFDGDSARRVSVVETDSRIGRVISPSGNVIVSGHSIGVVPIDPWPEPQKGRK